MGARDLAPSSSISVLLLAAGEARRFGRPKALACFAGEPLLVRLLRACREAGAAETVVVLGAAAADIAAACDLRAARVVVNPDFARGMTTSLQAGLRAAQPAAAAYALLPADLPLVDAPALRAVFAALPAARAAGRTRVIPVVAGRRGHPALFPAADRAALLALAPDAPAHGVFRARPELVWELRSDDPAYVSDLDTPDDYVRLTGLLAARGGG